MAKTRAQINRGIRQEALREQLCQQGHVQHVVDLTNKLADLDSALDNNEVNRLKIVIDTKLKLMNKYIPDLKSTEITGEGGDQLVITWRNAED